MDRKRVFEIAADHADAEVLTGTDPAMHRHANELHGTPADPNPTPPEHRHVSRGRVQIEWLGDVSPFAGEVLTAMNRMHLLPAVLAQALTKIALSIPYRVDGLTTRTLTQERDGMTETVTWGPNTGTYVREVNAKDADRILSSAAGREFRIVGYAGEHPSRDPIELYLPPSLRPTARRVEVHIGPEENLTGVDIATNNRMGTWEPVTR